MALIEGKGQKGITLLRTGGMDVCSQFRTKVMVGLMERVKIKTNRNSPSTDRTGRFLGT